MTFYFLFPKKYAWVVRVGSTQRQYPWVVPIKNWWVQWCVLLIWKSTHWVQWCVLLKLTRTSNYNYGYLTILHELVLSLFTVWNMNYHNHCDCTHDFVTIQLNPKFILVLATMFPNSTFIFVNCSNRQNCKKFARVSPIARVVRNIHWSDIILKIYNRQWVTLSV